MRVENKILLSVILPLSVTACKSNPLTAEFTCPKVADSLSVVAGA
jgi:hypothetical protein